MIRTTCNSNRRLNKELVIEKFKVIPYSIGVENMNSNDFAKLMLDEFIKSRNKLTDARFNYLLYLKGGDLESLKKNIKELGYELNTIGKGYEIVKESFIIKRYQKFFDGHKNREIKS
jgi:hypothetical protein